MAAVAAATKVITEYVLRRKLAGGDHQGLFSHQVKSAVLRRRDDLVIAGEDHTALEVVKRTCTFPLTDKGEMIAAKSEVVEVTLAD